MFSVIRVLKINDKGVFEIIQVLKVESGANYIDSIEDGCIIRPTHGFPSEAAADVHIREPLSYPNGEKAQAVVDAGNAGWMAFYNPTSRLGDPDNAKTILRK